MATRKTTRSQPTAKTAKAGKKAGYVSKSEQDALDLASSEKFEDVDVLKHSIDCMTIYGIRTLEGRAVPDFRDGLLPVQRRSLYAMYGVGSGNLIKSAKVVGLTLGAYHPHGDSSCYGAIANLVQSPAKLIHGEGNWGFYDDPKSIASMRYTECKLGSVAKSNYFTPGLISAYDMIANFDGSEKEPFVLHSNLPMILATGVNGIAVGMAINIPSFTLESLKEITRKAFKKKVTVRDCLNILEFSFPWGEAQLSDKSIQNKTFESLCKTGKGNLTFTPKYEYDSSTHTLTIKGVVANYTTAFAKTQEKGYHITDATTIESPGIEILVNMKKGRDKPTQDDIDEVLKIWESRTIVGRIGFLDREITDEAYTQGADFVNTKVVPHMGIADLINKWVDYRLDLEKRIARTEKAKLLDRIDKLNLIILARENFATLKKALDNAKPIPYFAKAVDISEEDSAYIFSRTLITLSKVDIEDTRSKISETKKQVKECNARIKSPNASCIQALDSVKV